MSADASLGSREFDGTHFDEFYDRALPIVYGYLLRLCGGNADEAWDHTQDTWMVVVDRGARGIEDLTVGYVLSVARSRYLDAWRRRHRLQRKLRLVWAGEREDEAPDVATSTVLDHLAECSAEHRVVLMLAYVDDVPVDDIAEMVGRSRSSTYSLLSRARAELRRHVTGAGA